MNGITIDWSMIDWKWVVTTALALYAAGISTFREYTNWRLWHPRIKVKLELGILAIYGPGDTAEQIQVWVENHGRTDILFNQGQLALTVKGSGQTLLSLDPVLSVAFPHTLKPGGSFHMMTDKVEMIRSVTEAYPGHESVQVRAVAYDAIGRTFRSKWQALNLTIASV